MENTKLTSFYKSIKDVDASAFETLLNHAPDAQQWLKKVGRFILMDRHRSQVFLPLVEKMGLSFPETVNKKSFKKEVERSSIGICLKYRNEEGILRLASSFERAEIAPRFQNNLLWAVSVYFDYKKTHNFMHGEMEYAFLNDYNLDNDAHRVSNAERKLKLVKDLMDLGFSPNRYAVGNWVVTLKKLYVETLAETKNVSTNINGEKHMYDWVRENIKRLEKGQEDYKSLIEECMAKKHYPSLSQHEIFIGENIKTSLKKDARLDWDTRTLVCFILMQESEMEKGDQLIEATIRREDFLLRENVFKFLVSYYRGEKLLPQGQVWKSTGKPMKSLDFLFNIVHSPELKPSSSWKKNELSDKRNFIKGYWPLWTNMESVWKEQKKPVVPVLELFKQMERVLEWSPELLLNELKDLSFDRHEGIEKSYFLPTILRVCMVRNQEQDVMNVFEYVAQNMEPLSMLNYFEEIRPLLEPAEKADEKYKKQQMELLHAKLLPVVKKIGFEKSVNSVKPLKNKPSPSPMNLSRF